MLTGRAGLHSFNCFLFQVIIAKTLYAGGNASIKSKYKETIMTFYFNLLKERLGLCKYSLFLQWDIVLELVTPIGKNMGQLKK